MLMKRRQFVQAGLGLMAGAGALALAGCGGDQSGSGDAKQASGKVYYLNFKPSRMRSGRSSQSSTPRRPACP